MSLQGKTALITGAARRIGREIALTLADHGADILIHYHRSKKDAMALRREIEVRRGVQAHLVNCDLSSAGGLGLKIRRLARKALSLAGSVDILVNNASVFYPTPLGRIREQDWDRFMTINLKAPFFLAETFGRHMFRRRSGVIINLVDWTGWRPHPDYLPYGISKAGLIAATAGLARALAPHVRVNSIAPGPILPSRGMAARQKRAVVGRTLLKRFGDPRDIAETVRFLCDGTDFVTGACIPVDGGSLAHC